MSAKEAVIEFIRQLPETITYPDLVDAIDNRFGRMDADGNDYTQDEIDTLWTDEINRRVADIEAGRAVGIPHEEVMREMREKYG